MATGSGSGRLNKAREQERADDMTYTGMAVYEGSKKSPERTVDTYRQKSGAEWDFLPGTKPSPKKPRT